MTNILKKSVFTILCCLAATTLWAETEKNPSETSKDTDIKGTSYTIDGSLNAGNGSAQAGDMTSKGIKFRINKTISEVSNAIEFKVNSGYTISALDLCGHVNDNSKTSELTDVKVDGNSITFTPVTLPAKSSSATISLSGISATSSIILVFDGKASQANIEYTVTYSGEGGGGGTTPEPEDKNPVVTDMTFTDQVGKAVIDAEAGTITAQIKNGGNLKAIEPKFTGTNITEWTPKDAQDFSKGAVEYTISGKGPVLIFNVTITEAEKEPETPDTPTPSGDIYAHWRFSGGEAPGNNTFDDGTNMRVEFLSSDDAKTFSKESATYNAAVPDDMKSKGSNGLKSGGSALFLKVTALNGQGFKKDDIVTLCGYNPWMISSTADHTGDISASLATGTGKGDYNIGSVTLQADAEALYMKRAEGTGTGICAIKVTRGGGTTPEPQPGDDPVAVSGVSLDKTELSLTAGQKTQLTATIQPSNATDKTLSWSSDNESVATVSNGYVSAVAEGTATITVTTKDGPFTATCTVTVTKKDEPEKPDTPIPSTDLTLHVPEVYEAKEIAGGYNTPLVVNGGREYEVYFMTRDSESEFCIATTSTDKTAGITTRSNDYECTATDGWFKFKGVGWSSSTDDLGAEFGEMKRRLDMDNTSEFSMHISGFDQFALVARDKKQDTSSGQTKPENNRYLQIYIDDVLQPLQFDANPSIRRYDVSSSEHVIRVVHYGSEKSAMYAFSLRVAQEPRAKRISGNDTTQVVYQTQALKPVRYFVKYASMGETKLEWNRAKIDGITLETVAGNELGDTLMLAGTANCPVGEYGFAVVSYYNGKETSRVPGKITVVSDIKSTSDINVTCYQGEEMDQITFRYYALSADDVTFKWTNGTPAGITNKGSDGKYVISGTPTATGDFPYEISVLGADTVIKGNVTVRPLDLGSNPVLYLYKNNINDGVYTYLQSKNWNLVDRKTLEDGLRPAEQYAKYKWILISEDADANNPEVLQLIRGGANIPVLNMNGFTYADGRLGWGEPNNGTVDTLTNNGCNIFVERSDHPIFNGFSGKNTIKIFSKIDTRGVMPIKVTLRGTHCLATAYTRDIEDYYEDGDKQTIIHEVPAAMRGGQKYICFPISKNSTANLTEDGKKLLDAIISYLTNSSASPIELPELQINRFVLEGREGTIDQANNTIEVKFRETDFVALDSLRNTKPVVTLADQQYSHLIPGVGNDDQAIDFRFSSVLPVTFTVTDYINIRTYSVSVRTYRPEGLENVYTAGEWVNIFDIYGRKVATTNEDIYTMPLPQGMYIVVTASGSTLKIMR